MIELFYQFNGMDAPQLYFGKTAQFTQSNPMFITADKLMVQTAGFPENGQTIYARS